MGQHAGRQPDLDLHRVRPAVLGQHGPYRPRPDPAAEGTGICHGGKGAGRLQPPHHQETPADQHDRHADRHDHPADPVRDLHGELPVLPGPGRRRADAFTGIARFGCDLGTADISVSAVRSVDSHFADHPQLQPAG